MRKEKRENKEEERIILIKGERQQEETGMAWKVDEKKRGKGE